MLNMTKARDLGGFKPLNFWPLGQAVNDPRDGYVNVSLGGDLSVYSLPVIPIRLQELKR